MSAHRLRATSAFTPIAIACGAAALAARPPATLGALAVTMAVGVMGALGGTPPPVAQRPQNRLRFLAAVGLGVSVFVAARWLRPSLPVSFAISSLAASTLAGVAEELFFRKLVYGWLTRWGPWVGMSGAAAAFAAVHVPAYGIAAVPVDLAAGMLFGWQRWASGGWEAPALTHVVANLVQFLR